MPAPRANPRATATIHTRKPSGRAVLVWLTLAVALVHLLLLQGLPDMLRDFGDNGDTKVPSFTTRTIPHDPLPPATAPNPAPTAKLAPAKPRAPMPVAAPVAKPTEPSPTETPPPTASEGTGAAAADQPPVPPSDSNVAGSTSGTDPATSTATQPAAPASAQVAATAGTTPPPPPEPPRKLVMPPSMRLLYDVKGVVTYAYTGGSELLWINQGDGYNARLQITKFGFNLRTWTSKGELNAQGLAPLRFGDKTRSEIASHFQRDKGIVSFSANTPDSPLQAGAQDYLSSFFQLAGMLAGEPQRYPPGSLIAFQVVNARSAEPWVFRVDGPETIELPDGPKAGIKLTREHDVQYDTKVELWLAPDLFYVPIRIRLSQGNGDFAELLWRSAQKPD